VQYAYVERPLELSHVQTSYAGRPFAVEMPSAGRPLRFSALAALQRRGVEVVPLTHGAGLSSTGDAELDARLPLPERFLLPEGTVRVVEAARRDGRRVIAVGTSVARAIEGAAAKDGALRAGEGLTDLRIGPHLRPRVVTGLLTGLHPLDTSHATLVEAWVARPLLRRALALAESRGYLCHELGDAMLVLPSATPSHPLVARGDGT
jgi:S-adenosylmethionine:tRNA ribosyltransferase-isomerase